MRALTSFLGTVLGFFCTVQLICCITVLLVWSNHRVHAASPRPELVEVRSMENCPPCDAVLAKLKADGVKYEVKITGMVTATSFPTCVFADGSWDNGTAVINGNYITKGVIPVTKLVQK